MSEYNYDPLSPSSIRLFRLLPSEDNRKHLQGELFEYPLQLSDKSYHPYEALSYVWGSEDRPESIAVNDKNLHITQNLYAVLLRLRDHICSRIIWIDAICIDQANEKEKEYQIPLMAEIYAKARCVVAWLGEAEDDGDRALEEIRLASEGSTVSSPNAKPSSQAISKLLQRPWFERIWILQEIAAARHILIMCGSTEIDGHAFASGLNFLDKNLVGIIDQVAFLIRGAVFRSRDITRKSEGLSLDICSLGELLDMYHTHKATKVHDKIYALLGMCSDDLSTARLEPNYTLHWSTLMERLVKFILGNQVSVRTWEDKEMAIITARGCILGKVSKVETNVGNRGGQTLEANFKNDSKHLKYGLDDRARWTLPTSAKLIQEGDFVCLLQGALKPTIVRLRKDFFTVIVVAATPPEHVETGGGPVSWSKLSQPVHFARDFLLVWTWNNSSRMVHDPSKYDTIMRLNSLEMDAGTSLADQLSPANRLWDVAMILGDLEEYQEEEDRLRAAVHGFNGVLGTNHQSEIINWHAITPLVWAAEFGHAAVVQLLLTNDSVDIDALDGQFDRTPLSWAARNGHEAVVKLLLKAGADVEMQDCRRMTPLSWAADNGHEAVVKLLLEAKANANAMGGYIETQLWRAIKKKNETLVKLLLEAKADVEVKDNYGRTPLAWAAGTGQETLIKLLLTAGANVNVKDHYNWTPLSWAADNGHKAIIKLLLEAKADVDAKNVYDRTPLSLAAENGHEAVVKLLLAAEADVNPEDVFGRTPLWQAAVNGHEAVAKLLRSEGAVV